MPKARFNQRVVSILGRSRSFARLVTLLEAVSAQREYQLHVLTYHRIDEPERQPGLNPVGLSTSPGEFSLQMEYLAKHCHVIGMQQVVDAFANGLKIPPRSVLLTFDDAYRDFQKNAWPIIKHWDMPATLFVPTAFPDHPERSFWWDRLYQIIRQAACNGVINTPLGQLLIATEAQQLLAMDRLATHVTTLDHSQALELIEGIAADTDAPPPVSAVLSWNALRELADEGVTMAPHTQTHPIMIRISQQQAQAEMAGSRRDLEREIGRVAPVFAYPGGYFDDRVANMVGREGFALAFTTCRGVNDLRMADRLRLRRINVGKRTTISLLRAQLLPWASRPLNAYNPLRNASQKTSRG